jgi:hypothetical protein
MAVLSGKKAVFTKAKQCIRLAGDRRWLHKATKEISKHWRHKGERHQTCEPLSRMVRQQAT